MAENLTERILEFDNLEISPTKLYIGFKLQKRVVTGFEVHKTKIKLRINLNTGTLDDPKGLFKDISRTGTYGDGNYEALLNNNTDIDYLMSLIRQAYNSHNE